MGADNQAQKVIDQLDAEQDKKRRRALGRKYGPAVTVLEQSLADVERRASELRDTINLFYTEAGLPPRFPPLQEKP